MEIGTILTAIIAIITFAFGYGILSQRVKSLECKINEVDKLREEVRKIADTLHELVGSIKTYMEMNK